MATQIGLGNERPVAVEKLGPENLAGLIFVDEGADDLFSHNAPNAFGGGSVSNCHGRHE